MEATAVRRGGFLPGLPATSSNGSSYTRPKHVGAMGIHAEKAHLQRVSTLAQVVSNATQSGADPRLCALALQDLVSPDAQVGKYKLGKYRVKKGDTLSDLSRKCGLPVEELAELNELEDPNLIQAGAQILLAFPRQFIEELAQSVPSRPREGATEAAQGPRLTVRVSERREGSAKVHEAPVLERERISTATPSQPVQSTSDSQHLRGEAAWSTTAAPGVAGLRTPAYTVSVNSVRVPRMGYRLSSQWASLGALLLIVAASSLLLRLGSDRLWGAYVSVGSHLAERKLREKDRRAALEAAKEAKKAEAQRMKNWWYAVVDDDRKAAQLAPDAVNGSVRSRLPSEPSIGKQAREIEQKRLEEEYNTFIRKIKVKEKDDGLIG
ncbi:hypothetical protein KFL_000500010 [Klebsormidium nitens]|uniref:LysM domain-containing protein n=1 Tax=Klebsormidium nitens TaxID=105231 RepID=A0A1Y1HST3_KLENI|nr:hypothetical protein KFL_000500010 [Klebsormidium nitens]|eukprot:GAQ80249.1 hypothetical protein KFL_000500010 [Klebsormidium nitens]